MKTIEENQEIPFIVGESVYDYEQRLFKNTEEKYGIGVSNARKEMSDELFLGFYVKGTINSGSASLQELKNYLTAAKLMQSDKSWENTEKAYSIGIDNVISDLEIAIKNFRCNINALSKDSIFYTGIESELSCWTTFTIRKYKVLSKKIYKTYTDSRTIFEVQELDYKGCIVGDEQFWLFLKDELIDIAWDNEDEVSYYEEKHRNTEGSYSYAHRDIFKIMEESD